jgi:hypothetical protein
MMNPRFGIQILFGLKGNELALISEAPLLYGHSCQASTRQQTPLSSSHEQTTHRNVLLGP